MYPGVNSRAELSEWNARISAVARNGDYIAESAIIYYLILFKTTMVARSLANMYAVFQGTVSMLKLPYVITH
jgi:hypothetical protein